MKSFIRKLFLLFCLFSFVGSAKAANAVYLAGSSAGGNTGVDCSNAKAYTYFNSSGNWSATPTGIQIGPDTTVHICSGTITGTQGQTLMTTQGSGTSGHPVTILFDSGAILSSPAWGSNSDGAINVPSSWIVVDGGTNGKIQNTNNGTSGGACITSCTIQVGSEGVFLTGANNVVHHLTVTKIYVKKEGTNDDSGDDSAGIENRGSGFVAHDNTLDNMYGGIVTYVASGTLTGLEYYNNTVSFCNHCLKTAMNGGTISACTIHNNDLSNMYNWDQSNNHYHHNFIFSFADPAGSFTCSYYDNNMHGIASRDTVYGMSHVTGMIFLQDHMDGSKIYNNLVNLDSGDLFGAANGIFTMRDSHDAHVGIYNNTVSEPSNVGSTCMFSLDANVDFRNNIFKSCGRPVYQFGTFSDTTSSTNNNIYYDTDPSNAFTWKTTTFVSFSSWKSLCSCDNTNSTYNTTNPLLNSNGTLQAGSPAISFGANLTSLGITALNSDLNGVARPGSGAWDGGAIQYGAAPPPTPQPPLLFLTDFLPNGTVNSSFSSVIATGGTKPFIWSGSLFPSGLTPSATGVLSGLPNTPGTFSVLLNLKDSSQPQQSLTKTLSQVINPEVIIPPPTSIYSLKVSIPSLVYNYQVGGSVPACQKDTVGDTAPSGINYGYLVTPNVNWVSVTPNTGRTASDISVCLVPTSLTASGTYSGVLNITSNNPQGTSANANPVTVVLTAIVIAPVPPVSPKIGVPVCTLRDTNKTLRCDTDIQQVPRGQQITNTVSSPGVTSGLKVIAKP